VGVAALKLLLLERFTRKRCAIDCADDTLTPAAITCIAADRRAIRISNLLINNTG
jgi:hypothetical protein